MKYIKAYEKMLDLLVCEDNIVHKLSVYYRCDNKTFKNTEYQRDIIEKIIRENNDFKNVGCILTLMYNLYVSGVIEVGIFRRFTELLYTNKEIMNIAVFTTSKKPKTIYEIGYNKAKIKEDSDEWLIYENSEGIETITRMDLLKFFDLHESDLDDMILRCSESNEKLFYKAYSRFISNNCDGVNYNSEYPQLLPQYVLNVNSFSIKENNNQKENIQRADFAFIINHKIILIEIDGPEHYEVKCNNGYSYSNEKRISEERTIDRNMTLEGYEFYRFLNYDIKSKYKKIINENYRNEVEEFNIDELVEYLTPFFDKLFEKHNIKLY